MRLGVLVATLALAACASDARSPAPASPAFDDAFWKVWGDGQAELAAYDLVPPEIARRALVQKVPVLPRGAAGMTIGRFVFLLRDDARDGSSQLLAHELVHVQQYRRQGYLTFSARYLWHYGHGIVRLRNHKKAYRAIPAETEAYAAAAAWAKARRARDNAANT